MPEQVPTGASSSNFTPPANTGLGFLELVPDADILAMADPNDADGDGISGEPNLIELPYFVSPHTNAIVQNGKYIHRFGKKAAAYNLLHQTVNAYCDLCVYFFAITRELQHKKQKEFLRKKDIIESIFV